MAHYNMANKNKVQICRLLTEFVENVMCPKVSDENTSVSYVTAELSRLFYCTVWWWCRFAAVQTYLMKKVFLECTYIFQMSG